MADKITSRIMLADENGQPLTMNLAPHIIVAAEVLTKLGTVLSGLCLSGFRAIDVEVSVTPVPFPPDPQGKLIT